MLKTMSGEHPSHLSPGGNVAPFKVLSHPQYCRLLRAHLFATAWTTTADAKACTNAASLVSVKEKYRCISVTIISSYIGK